jgi:ferritin-like metal-binding protein YciE
MANDNLKQLAAQGLAAMRAGSDVAEAATSEITNDASHPDLKAALEEGNRTSKQWAERLDRARQQVDGGAQQDNPILDALYEVSRRIRQQAPDTTSRDLGIIANGQLALHYWIAAFGTMRAYAERAGLSGVAQSMKTSLDEAKRADEAHNAVAGRIMAA